VEEGGEGGMQATSDDNNDVTTHGPCGAGFFARMSPGIKGSCAENSEIRMYKQLWLPHGSENESHLRQACVLQLDICKFTHFARQVTALELANVLHQLFSAFDTQVQQMGLFKIDNVGDAYIVAGWLPHLTPHDASESSRKAQESAICSKMLFLGGSMLDILENYTVGRIVANESLRTLVLALDWSLWVRLVLCNHVFTSAVQACVRQNSSNALPLPLLSMCVKHFSVFLDVTLSVQTSRILPCRWAGR